MRRTFPTSLAAALFGFGPRVGFEAAEGSDVAPTVDFGNGDGDGEAPADEAANPSEAPNPAA